MVTASSSIPTTMVPGGDAAAAGNGIAASATAPASARERQTTASERRTGILLSLDRVGNRQVPFSPSTLKVFADAIRKSCLLNNTDCPTIPRAKGGSAPGLQLVRVGDGYGQNLRVGPAPREAQDAGPGRPSSVTRRPAELGPGGEDPRLALEGQVEEGTDHHRVDGVQGTTVAFQDRPPGAPGPVVSLPVVPGPGVGRRRDQRLDAVGSKLLQHTTVERV